MVLIIIYFPLFWCHLRQKSQQQRVSTSKLLSDAFRERGMRYFIFAVIDVEGNYLLHKAFQYTTFTSIQVVTSIPKFKTFPFFVSDNAVSLHCCRFESARLSKFCKWQIKWNNWIFFLAFRLLLHPNDTCAFMDIFTM